MTPGEAVVHLLVPGDLQTPTGGYGYDLRLISGLEALGWRVERLACVGAWPDPATACRAELRQVLARVPDGALILADGLAYGAMAEEAAAEAGRLRFVALVHHPLGDETGIEHSRREALLASERAALAEASAVICTSSATAHRLAEAFGVAKGRITVAPPGTDPGPRSQVYGGPPRILSIGSLIPRKRHDVLIAALASLADRPWTARIVGSSSLDPACSSALRSQVEAAKLADRVTLCGSVADTRAELAQADVFALASEYEGYGMAFAEALSQGVPVVACRAGAIADLVPEAAGGLADPGNAESFAAALAPLLDDGARRWTAAEAAFTAGRKLPTWRDTAAIVCRCLSSIRTSHSVVARE